MKFGGGLEINNNFCCFVLVLLCLLSVRLFTENNREGLTNEVPLYYDETTFKTTTYNPDFCSNGKASRLSKKN